MASYNGISLKVGRYIDKKGDLRYQGELYLGEDKIAFWRQAGEGPDLLRSEYEFSKYQIMNVIKDVDKTRSFERNMYELATLAEMDTAFKRARYYGFKGIGCVLSESKYAYIEITEEQAKEGEKKIRELLKEDIEKMEAAGEHPEVRVYTQVLSFKVGEPVDRAEIIKIPKHESEAKA